MGQPMPPCGSRERTCSKDPNSRRKGVPVMRFIAFVLLSLIAVACGAPERQQVMTLEARPTPTPSVPTATPTATNTPTPSPTPTPTPTPIPPATATALAAPTATAQAIATISAAATATARPTPTPTLTPTPRPTPTPSFEERRQAVIKKFCGDTNPLKICVDKVGSDYCVDFYESPVEHIDRQLGCTFFGF